MQNLSIPAPATPLPASAPVHAVPGVTDLPSGSDPENSAFSAILAQHVIGIAGIAAGLEPDAALPGAATVEDQLQQAGSGTALLPAPLAAPLHIPPHPNPVAAALPAALSTETSARHNPPPAALPGKQVLESDNAADFAAPGHAADFAAPGRFLPPVAAGEKASRPGTGEQLTQRFPGAAPLPEMTNPSLAAAAPHASAPAPATHDLKLELRVAAPGWGGELAQKVVWMATRQLQVAELRLNPPQLGPMEVMLTIGHDEGVQASVQFASPHLAVREAIEAALPRLREMMANNGISLGNVSISADSFQQQAEAGRQDHPWTKQHADHPDHPDNPATVAGFAAQPTASFMRSGRNGLVDTFA